MARHLIGRRGFLTMTGGGLLLPGLAGAGAMEALSGEAFGTGWSVTAPHLPRGVGDAVARLFADFDGELSPWSPESALSRFNRDEVGIAPGSELDVVARAALALAEESGGAFDPTVGPLVARWGFGPIEGGAPDWRAVTAGAEIGKARGDLTLDLCGIAKGRALDLALALLRADGVDAGLFDLGGEVAAIGAHPSGRPWRVAVEDPLGGAAVLALELADGQALATSGLAAQSYALGGRTWGHIIDPRAGQPVEGRLRSVTVLSDSAMRADGWATALFAAGDVEGPRLARVGGIAALFLFEEGGRLQQVATGGIEASVT